MRILIINDPCGRPYLVRYTFGSIFGRELKLHVMLRSDNDRELHDHPWGFLSLVLAGGYDEEVPDGVIARNAGALDFRPPEWRHRVKLRPGTNFPWPVRLLRFLDRSAFLRRIKNWDAAQAAFRGQWLTGLRMCVTLVLTTKRVRTWGFWRQGRFIPHNLFKSDIEC